MLPLLNSIWKMRSPAPALAPVIVVALKMGAGQVETVLATSDVRLMSISPPLQMLVATAVAVILGFGFTVTVIVTSSPIQAEPPLILGRNV